MLSKGFNRIAQFWWLRAKRAWMHIWVVLLRADCFSGKFNIFGPIIKIHAVLVAEVSYRGPQKSDPAEHMSMTEFKRRENFHLKFGLICYIHKDRRYLLVLITSFARTPMKLFHSKSHAIIWPHRKKWNTTWSVFRIWYLLHNLEMPFIRRVWAKAHLGSFP